MDMAGDLKSIHILTSREGSTARSATRPALTTEKSRGVLQMELLSSRVDTRYRILLYGGFALLAYVMSLGEPSRFPTYFERR